MPWIFSAVFIVVEAIAVASAIHALFTVRTAQGTIAWVIGLITFPWLGLPLYWFFGSRRFDSHSKVMRDALTTHQAKIHELREEMKRFQVPRLEIRPPRVGDLVAVAGEQFLRGNRLDLLIDGEATFDAIFSELPKAKRCIFVQFYIMREDGLGLRLLEALAARAADGIQVCVLFDRVGSAAMTPAIIEKWRGRGIRMASSCAYSKWRDRWQLNFRNHRKNVIVDGRVGFIGGHNVGDEYLGINPKFGCWRDTHVRIEGPTAMQLQMVFLADWYFAAREVLAGHWDPNVWPEIEGQRALVLSSGPSDKFERCTLFFLNVIAMAEKRLWIASP